MGVVSPLVGVTLGVVFVLCPSSSDSTSEWVWSSEGGEVGGCACDGVNVGGGEGGEV